jgi:hypothetical protein
MEKGKNIVLTLEEIQMTQSFCKDIVELKPENFTLITSILSKLDPESSEVTIRIKPTVGKKGGRPRKVIPTVPKPLEVIPEIITSIEEPKPIGKKRGRPRKVIPTVPKPLEVIPEIITSIEEPKLIGKKRGRLRKEVPLLSKPDHEETPVPSDLIEEPKPSDKKRGRPKRVFKSEEQQEVSHGTEPETPEIKEVSSIKEPEPIEVKEVPSKIEPEPMEETSVRTDPVEEHEPEPQPIITSGNPEMNQEEPGQTTNTDSEKPILTRFQTFLKKLRPSKHQ